MTEKTKAEMRALFDVLLKRRAVALAREAAQKPQAAETQKVPGELK